MVVRSSERDCQACKSHFEAGGAYLMHIWRNPST